MAVAYAWRVRIGAKLPLAAAITGLVFGTAFPAHGQTPAPSGETGVYGGPDESRGPDLTPRVEPIPAAPISNPESSPGMEPRMVHRPRTGLRDAGAATLGVSYAVAVLLGINLLVVGDGGECGHCSSQGVLLMLPVAGPLVVAWTTPGGARSGELWPFAVWSGVEAAGAALLIAGWAGHDVLEWHPRDPPAKVSLVPTLTPRVGALSLNVSW
jgi:hypothetical protein